MDTAGLPPGTIFYNKEALTHLFNGSILSLFKKKIIKAQFYWYSDTSIFRVVVQPKNENSLLILMSFLTPHLFLTQLQLTQLQKFAKSATILP